MGRNTSISLGDHFEAFVDGKVASGSYQNASEVIRAGLRLLEQEDVKITLLRKAIEEGLGSGLVEDYDPKKHLAELKKSKARRAR